jgi:hypothetical protein
MRLFWEEFIREQKGRQFSRPRGDDKTTTLKKKIRNRR